MFPHQKYLLGHVLGLSINEYNEMVQNMLNQNDKIVLCRTLRLLTIEEVRSPVEINKCNYLDAIIVKLLGNTLRVPSKDDLDSSELHLCNFSDPDQAVD